MRKILLGMILFFTFLPNLVSAQSLFHAWYEYLNIPQEYSKFPNLLYFVLIPFLGTFSIIWGILTNLHIFHLRKVNILLSFVFAFALLYSGALLALVGVLFQIGAVFGVVAFFVLFIVLTGFWVGKRSYSEYETIKEIHKKYESAEKRRKSIDKELKNIEKEIEKINKMIKRKRRDINNERARITPLLSRRQRDNILAKISVLQSEIKDLEVKRQRLEERKDTLHDELVKSTKV